MDGFKNSTKTQYSKGGPACYAKGGSVKGAAKVSKVMGEFKSGKLHSGSKEGPEVSSPKQAVAIALSEARKVGAKIPLKKAAGGPATLAELNAANAATGSLDRAGEAAAGRAVARGNRVQAEEAGEDAVLRSARPKADDFRKAHGLEVSRTTVREIPARGPSGAGFRGEPVVSVKPMVNAVRSAMKEVGLNRGGLSAMPSKKTR